MCFMLYVASGAPLLRIAFDAASPSFHTKALDPVEAAVAQHFSLSHVAYAGSSEGCGCDFNYASNDGALQWRPAGPGDGISEADNMRRLREYIDGVIRSSGTVELYGCWDGDFAEPPLIRERITADELVQPGFFLKERCLYCVS